MKHLSKTFYQNGDVLAIAESLVGKVIRTEINGIVTSGRIVETEAYRGKDDLGCHSYIHGKTDRTAAMFEAGGVAYVYICYGMHHMVNVVTNQKEHADAVLIRAIEPLIGLDEMIERRGKTFKNYHLSGGPGKVCQCLGIDKSMNKIDYSDAKSMLQILDDGYKVESIISTPRVGMSKHVGNYSNNPWRFYEIDNNYVSRPLKLWYDWDEDIKS
jgi:DNA-3-methyladenine glycosylase